MTASRGLGLWLIGSSMSACTDPLGPLVFPDGTYVIQLQDPIIVDPFVTPSWMGTEPTIYVTKTETSLLVTSSAGDLVVAGPAARFEQEDSMWLAHFEWRESPRHHYWAVRFSADRCHRAEAVDADLGVGPGGVWTVAYTRCVIVRD